MCKLINDSDKYEAAYSVRPTSGGRVSSSRPGCVADGVKRNDGMKRSSNGAKLNQQTTIVMRREK